MFSSACRRGLISCARGAGGLSPLSLFAAGETGGWWDASDLTTQFQDSAGTTPVTASGQPVGKVLDKSGRGNHWVQATTTSRPTLTQDATGWYWALDGVDDSWTVVPGAWWAQPFHQFAAVRYDNSMVTDGNLSISTNTASIMGAASGFYRISSGTVLLTARVLSETAVLSALHNGATSSIQKNNVAPATGNAGTTNPSGTLRVGAASAGAAQLMQGRFYGAVFVGRACTAAEVAMVKAYLGNKCGLSL